jgi:1,4-alpha-glucan branching enzyme
VRQPGRSAAGEEPLHGLIADTYAPMLAGLYDLVDRGAYVRLGLALSPLLLDQLADPVVQKHTVQSLEQAIVLADQRVRESQERRDDHAAYLAQFYAQLHRRNLHIFERQWGRNLVTATRTLAEAGVIEVVAQTATHIVTQLHDRVAVRTQLETGLISIMRHLGQRPTVLWAADDPLTPELLELLPPLGIQGVVAPPNPDQPLTTAYWLDQAHQVWGVSADPRLINNIASASLGYPGDALYRASPTAPLGDVAQTRTGAPYDPFHAYARARLHARHFVAVAEEMARATPAAGAPRPLIVASAMELFGSGWFEGGLWLRTVIEELHPATTLRLVLPSALADRHLPLLTPPAPAASSAPNPVLAAAFQQLRAAVEQYPRTYGDREQVLNQAARELLLAQSGDWDRWTGPGHGYAQTQRDGHLARFARLLELAEHEVLLPVAAREFAELQERDNPFPTLNYRLFGAADER